MRTLLVMALAGLLSVALHPGHGLPTAPPAAGTAGVVGDTPGAYFDPGFDLGVLPAPTTTGVEIVDGLDRFVTDFPYRLTGGPTEVAAAGALRDEMDALGYEAAIEDVALAAGAPTPLKAVTALKRGETRPDEWILFVGHYDTVPQTIYGAYDNGAGTNLLRVLAKELAEVPTNRSIMFAWYNGEEEGLLASKGHAAALADAGQEITAVLGFDMVGIAWPVGNLKAESCLCLFHGPDDRDVFKPLLEHVNFDFLGFPDKKREVTVAGVNTRNSDERSFADQGYRTLRWAGMRTAAAYPAYHKPDDTLDTMIAVAGGREFVEAGSRNTLVSAYYTALALDNRAPTPRFTVTVAGTTVTLDAGGTTDDDGPVGDLVWDLGDGSTATGPEVEHTYAAPGTYTVTLTAHDALWPATTRVLARDVDAG